MKKLLDVSDLSRGEVVAFTGSNVWSVMRRHLEERLETLIRMVEIAPLDDVWGETKDGRPVLNREGVRRIQGAMTEIRFMLALPQSYIDELTETKRGEE